MLHTNNRTSTTTAETGRDAVSVVRRIVSRCGLVPVIARIGVIRYFSYEAAATQRREPCRRAPGNPHRSARRTGPVAFTVRDDQQGAWT
jgi:hypothetical protein